MIFDSRDGNYHGTLPDGREIIVDGDAYAESEQDAERTGGDVREIESPLAWEEAASAQEPGDDTIRIVKK